MSQGKLQVWSENAVTYGPYGFSIGPGFVDLAEYAEEAAAALRDAIRARQLREGDAPEDGGQ